MSNSNITLTLLIIATLSFAFGVYKRHSKIDNKYIIMSIICKGLECDTTYTNKEF